MALSSSFAPRVSLNDSEPIDNCGSVVVTVVENRAREVCICKVDDKNPSVLEIYLLADSHSYNETIDALLGIAPNEILLHDGCRHKTLSKTIEKLCTTEDARFLYISRQYFDQDMGAELLKKVLVGEIDADLVAKYIVLSGAHCLLRYRENCTGVTLANHSMRVEYGTGRLSAKMLIDRRTALNLELVGNANNGNQKNSLFGAIDRTKTVVGARLLKSTILRPNADAATINARLDLVVAFLGNNRVFSEVVEQLRLFPDLDKMLAGLTSVPKSITPKTARTGIDTLIYLKQTLRVAPALAGVLRDLSDSSAGSRFNPFETAPAAHTESTDEAAPKTLLEAIVANLQAPVLDKLLAFINEALTESTEFSRNTHSMRHQECFALKTGVHGMLDLARQIFLQTVEDIHNLAEQYSLEHSVTMKVVYSSTRGYYLSLPASFSPLPAQFTQSVANKRTISCSTEKLTSLSDRAIEAITQALTLTHELTQDLLTRVRNNMQHLFSIADCVALLDMLSSFVDLAALSPHPFTRPIIAPSVHSPLVIKGGRHPVVSAQSAQQLTSSFVANDIFMSPDSVNMHVITGPNGSGKTVFIKQVALIVIIAQLGCFVPAKHATIPLRDRLLSRIGNDDDIEHNMSTFATEMREAAYLLSNLTPASLVIVDELGRGTSNIDGVSLAFSIAEHLLHTKALSLFVTHYTLLTSLPNMYPNVKNFHLRTTLTALPPPTAGPTQDQGGGSSSSHSMVYLHTVAQGTCDLQAGYGLTMAEQCDFPRDIIEEARGLQQVVREAHPTLGEQGSDAVPQNVCGVALYSLLHHLLLLKDSNQDDVALRVFLSNLRSKLSDEAVSEMLEYLSGDVSQQEEESNAPCSATEHLEYLRGLENSKVSDAEEASLESEVNGLETEIDALRRELETLNQEKVALRRKKCEVSTELLRKREVRDELMEKYNLVRLENTVVHDQVASIEDETNRVVSNLEKHKQINAMNDAFYIWYAGPYATINSFRLGNLANKPIEFTEINAALGQAALVVNIIAAKAGVDFKHFLISPMGSFPKIVRGDDKKTSYPLYIDSSSFSLFPKRNFNLALQGFMSCILELGDYIANYDPTLSMPFKIAVGDSKIGDLSFVYGNDDEVWTRSLKFMLADIKWIIAWYTKHCGYSNADGGGLKG